MDFPSNSQAPKPQEPKKIEKIVLGEVTRKQKSLGRRFMETFVSGEDASSVMGYILFDVVVPAAKDLASDAFSQMVERIRRSEEHTSELQSQSNLVCRLLLEKKKVLVAA